MSEFLNNIKNQFEKFCGENPSNGIVNDFRIKSFENFNNLGLPTTKDEDWRFTNLNEFYKNQYSIPPTKKEFNKNLISNSISDLDAHFIYLYNGKLVENDNIDNVVIKSLSSFLNEADLNTFNRFVDNHSVKNRDFTFELNSAFINDGVFIDVNEKAVIDKPIVLINYFDSSTSFSSYRNLINFNTLSSGQVVEYTFSDRDINFFSNKTTSFFLGDSTNVEHLSIDESSYHSYIFSNLKISQTNDSNFTTDSILIGGKIYRNNVHPVLNGQGSNSNILGLYLSKENQHMDNYMFVEHVEPNCGSRQLYKGLLKDSSKGVFHGRILVHNEAQKTDAKQTNRNLLLSDKAQVDTKPQLEIYADDVKCTHGATTGQIDKEALYYLRARGINLEDAKLIMIRSFTEELLEFINSNFILELHKKIVEEWFLNSDLAKTD